MFVHSKTRTEQQHMLTPVCITASIGAKLFTLYSVGTAAGPRPNGINVPAHTELFDPLISDQTPRQLCVCVCVERITRADALLRQHTSAMHQIRRAKMKKNRQLRNKSLDLFRTIIQSQCHKQKNETAHLQIFIYYVACVVLLCLGCAVLTRSFRTTKI